MSVASLEPVPLEALAEHMRDRTWLDMRVIEHGLLKRVRVFEIVVMRDEEDVHAEQEYLELAEDDGNDPTEVGRTTYRFAQDMVRWAKPTSFTIEDIDRPLTPKEQEQMERAAEWGRKQAEWESKIRVFDADPLGRFPPHQDEMYVKRCLKLKADRPDVWKLRDVILQAVSDRFGPPIQLILRGTATPQPWCRKWCIRMMWELTDISQTNVAELFGYNGGGMVNDALGRTEDHSAVAKDLLKRVKNYYPTWGERRGVLFAGSRQKKLLA